ncbi:phytoene/squalene synthase family protein [Streptomyces chitinivorans]|uniref:Phytoene/squalene synthase family protein n=1 Tax=Streptomyces chitinivorans TaxID=1257027 RepID=A0ABW7I0G6_9ACTN|nr:phytoene/squalene synthase family protein [Streptomyces chitinivorans]MDH2408598.1 phytoene/squalene synthase family protein [Streptomyces chitinivorans]
MTARELDAAGVHDPALRAAYTRCRELNARHGRTYFLATRLLTPRQRPAVHALYGFARWADDIVDDLDPALTPEQRARALAELDEELSAALRTGRGGHPVIAALADTAARYAIDPAHFTDFMRSMAMDLHVTEYPTLDDLRVYMHGSAAVVGLQVLPVLDTVVPRQEAAPHAAALGVAFQLTNFLRDVGEDLDRGRIYLPLDRLAAHGVDRDLLLWCRRAGRADARVRAALRELCETTRGIYREAEPGIAMLHPVSRPCVRAAFVLYRAILDRIEAAGYAVLHRRAVVPRRRRAAVALGGLADVAASRARGALTGDLPRVPGRPRDLAGKPAGRPAKRAEEAPRTRRRGAQRGGVLS